MTQNQRWATGLGVVAALAGLLGALQLGLITPTRAGFQTCAPFPPSWVDDGGMVTVRVGAARFSHAALLQLGFPAGSPAFAYGAMEVQTYPAFLADGVTPDWSQLQPVPGIDLVGDGDLSIRASPLQPTCQLAARMQGAASALFQCACPQDATCLGPDAGPATLGLTLGAGEWTGAGCIPKPCREISGSSSWPAACPGGS